MHATSTLSIRFLQAVPPKILKWVSVCLFLTSHFFIILEYFMQAITAGECFVNELLSWCLNCVGVSFGLFFQTVRSCICWISTTLLRWGGGRREAKNCNGDLGTCVLAGPISWQRVAITVKCCFSSSASWPLTWESVEGYLWNLRLNLLWLCLLIISWLSGVLLSQNSLPLLAGYL